MSNHPERDDIPNRNMEMVMGTAQMAAGVFFYQLVEHPFSRVATILRTQHALPKAYGASFYTPVPTTASVGEEIIAKASESVKKTNLSTTQQVPFKGAIDVFRKLPKDITLWRGFAPDFYSRMLGKLFHLQFADHIKNLIQPWAGRHMHKDPNDPSNNFLKMKALAISIMSGVVGGGVAFIFTYPFTLVSTRMQCNLIPLHEVKNNVDWGTVNKTNFSNVWQSFKSITKLEGIRGLYSGCTAPLLGIAVYRGVNFAMFDGVRSLGMSNNYSMYEKIFLSQVTILTAGFFSYPFGVIVDRLRVQTAFRKSCSQEESQLFYKGLFDSIRKIHQQEGIRGFYRGYSYALVKNYAGAFLTSMFALGWRQ